MIMMTTLQVVVVVVFYLYSDGLTGRRNYDAVGFAPTIYDSTIFELDLNDMKAFGFTHFGEDARLNTNGVWHTDAFIANGVNTQYICSWMQSRGLNTASDVYNYLVANGATFTVNTGIIYGGDGADPVQHVVCVQCPNLYYDINTTNGDSSISYDVLDLSGVNIFSISSGTGGEVSGPVGSQTSVSYPVTDFSSYLSH